MEAVNNMKAVFCKAIIQCINKYSRTTSNLKIISELHSNDDFDLGAD
jgi:hypothetical protein